MNIELTELNQKITELEKAQLVLALKEAGGNIGKAAQGCGVSEVDFILKLKEYNMLRVH